MDNTNVNKHGRKKSPNLPLGNQNIDLGTKKDENTGVLRPIPVTVDKDAIQGHQHKDRDIAAQQDPRPARLAHADVKLLCR